MNERRTRINAQYATAEKRLKDTEDEIRRVSHQRLAELMKLSEHLRFVHLDDALLIPPDRTKLRRSFAVSLHRGVMKNSLSFCRSCLRWLWRWLRYRLAAAVAVVAIAGPLSALTVVAWRNTGERIILPQQPIALNWKLPSGATERRFLGAGDSLVIVPQSGTLAVARWWIAGQGYATAIVNIDWHLVR